MAGRTRTNLGLKLDIINRYHGAHNLHTDPTISPYTEERKYFDWVGIEGGGEEGGG